MGTAGQGCDRPSVPGVERIGVDDVRTQLASEPRQSSYGARPVGCVAEPICDSVGSRDPAHGHDVYRCTEAFILRSQRRLGGNHHMTRELACRQRAQESDKAPIRTTAFRNRLD